jgi:DNA-binding FadR family transcriptional regulator
VTPHRSRDPLPRLRSYVSQQNLALNGRLPPERKLCVQLGLTRAALRKAMGILQAEGQVWRQVGRGTFIGARPVPNLAEVQYLSSVSSPSQIMDARLAIEPELARLAALHGVAADFAELRLCNRCCRDAESWRVFESWDNRFHYAMASATRNKLLITLFETLNAVRRSLVWQTLRADQAPAPNYATFFEHDAIYDAISRREPDRAAEAMRTHLISVSARLVRAPHRVRPPETANRSNAGIGDEAGRDAGDGTDFVGIAD